MSTLKIICLSLILFKSISSQTSTYCPSDDWVECGVNGKNNNLCYIPPSVTSATISYGVAVSSTPTPNTGRWTFTSVTNTAGKDLVVICDGSNLGDPGVVNNNENGGCCYNIKNQGPSINEANWKFIASQQEPILIKDNPTLIRYGIADQYSYRYILGEYTCSDKYFANTFYNNASAIKNCYAYQSFNKSDNQTSSINYQFIPCGDSTGSALCNELIVPNGNSIVLMKYGQKATNNYLFRYGLSQSGDFPCNDGAFGPANGNNEDNFCFVANNTMFVGASGSWKVVESCAGTNCIIDTKIEYGVTSTTSTACSESWTDSLSKTVGESLSFFHLGVSHSMTETQSMTVDNLVSTAYTTQTELSCEAKCGNGSSADWTLYQWVMNVGEYVTADIKPFNVNACNYVCTTSSTEPACPPGYCTPGTECSNCTGYP